MTTLDQDTAIAERAATEVVAALFGGRKTIKFDVPLSEDTCSRARIETRQQNDGTWTADVEYKWPEGPGHWKPVATGCTTQAKAELAGARELVDFFGAALRSARLSREAQECVGNAISELAAYRNRLENSIFQPTTNREEEPVGQGPTGSSSLSPSNPETTMPATTSKTKARRDRRKERREETNGHANGTRGSGINGDASAWREALLAGKTLEEINAVRAKVGLPPAKPGEFHFEPDEHGVYRFAPPIPLNGERQKDAGQKNGIAKIDLTALAGKWPALKIDPDFEALSLAATDEEWELLRASIATTGKCRDPITVWPDGGDLIVLDGHRRLTLCTKFGFDFELKRMPFPSRAAALEWTRDEQLARRNLTEAQKSYLRGKAYLAERKEVGKGEKKRKGAETQGRQGETNGAPHETNGASVSPLPGGSPPPNVAAGSSQPAASAVPLTKSKPISTAEKIARLTGVSARTVKRDAKFAEAVEKLPAAEKAEVLAGKKSKAEVAGTPAKQPKAKELPKRPDGRQFATGLFELAGKPSLATWRREFLRWALIEELRSPQQPRGRGVEELEEAADALHVFLSDHWVELVENSHASRDESLLAQFFSVLSKTDLAAVARQAGIFVGKMMTRETILNLLWNRVQSASLPIPDCLKVGAKKKGAKRGR